MSGIVGDDSGKKKKEKEVMTAMDPYEFLKLTKNPDGSLTRNLTFPLVPPRSGDGDIPTLSRDVTLNEEKKTWIRLHRPNTPPPAAKLPLVVHFHGGGFVMFSAATAPFDEFCARASAYVPAVVASVDYRLAPEHRLPAAFDDARDALEWLRDNAVADEWLRDYADLGRCFLDGSSAGGNIAYRAAAMATRRSDLGPLAIAGLMLNVPYFGGSGRTDSELRLIDDRVVPLPASDLLWDLALPVGSNRDHEYCNPMGSVGDSDREWIGLLPRCLVRGYGGDPLVDRQKEFVKMLERFGVEVVSRFSEDGFHAVELFDPVKAQQMMNDVKDFILGSHSML